MAERDLEWGCELESGAPKLVVEEDDEEDEGISCRDCEVNYSGRKEFLRSYPLLWEKEMEHLTVMKAMQRRLKNIVARMLLVKKLKQKIASSAYFVGSWSARGLNLHMPLFESRHKPQNFTHVVTIV